jgi:hypothetical protein
MLSAKHVLTAVVATMLAASAESALALDTQFKSQMVVGAGGRVSFVFVRVPSENVTPSASTATEARKPRWVFRWLSPHGWGYVYER